MKNLIHVIYPDESIHSYVMESSEGVEYILEMVFGEWNHGSGMESELFMASKKRSLSVNDVVCVNGRYYQCAVIGWNEVSMEFVDELEVMVSRHPKRMEYGAWFALSEVMWECRKKECVEA